MSKPRSRIRGPRFALTNPEKCRACIKCVYGNGEHAEWCEKRLPFDLKDGDPVEVMRGGSRARWKGNLEGHYRAQFWYVRLVTGGLEWASLDNLLPQRAPAEKVQPVETELESANA